MEKLTFLQLLFAYFFPDALVLPFPSAPINWPWVSEDAAPTARLPLQASMSNKLLS